MLSARTTQSEVNTIALVVDDDNDIRSAIARMLSRCGCTVTEAASIEDAIEKLKPQEFNIIFSDLRFEEGQMNGEDLLAYTTQEYPATKVVLMSASINPKQKSDLLGKGAAYCLQKPFFKNTCLEVLSEIAQAS